MSLVAFGGRLVASDHLLAVFGLALGLLTRAAGISAFRCPCTASGRYSSAVESRGPSASIGLGISRRRHEKSKGDKAAAYDFVGCEHPRFPHPFGCSP